MRKPILAALIAATALAPFVAAAQERRGRGMSYDREAGSPDAGNRGEQRAARPDGGQVGGVDRQAYRQQREAQQAQQQQVQQQQAQQAQQVQQQRAQAQTVQQAAPQAYQRGQRQQFEQQQRALPSQFREDRRDAARQVDRSHADRQQFDRQQFDRQQVNRQQYNQQQYRGGNTGIVPPQYRQDGRDYRNNGSRYDGRSNNGWNNSRNYDQSRNWNRTWRNDSRYNWQGWRNQNRNAYRLPRYYAPRGYGYGYQRFGIGVTLGAILYGQNYWINDPWSYRLPEAYEPYQWVRYYNDALLVDTYTGEVVDVIYDIFW